MKITRLIHYIFTCLPDKPLCRTFALPIMLGILMPNGLWSQTQTITGTVTDSLAQTLPACSVMLLQRQDSTLEAFAITDDRGRFRLPGIVEGEYWLQATFLGYEDYWQAIDFAGTDDLILSSIVLSPQAALLSAVEVSEERLPIRIRQDTITYDAKAFSTQPNAVVEDLLRQLPGIDVDREGNLTAQGERVEQVLVDGKPFFGSDPTLATQNLPADAIDKVEVYDEASDAAEFTGIDDGREQKTINLQLDEEHKTGAFGNVEGGLGTEDHYQTRASVHRFSPAQQLSVLGLANNINERGFSINEYLNFLGGMERLMRGGGGMMRIEIDGNDSPIPLDAGDSNIGLTETMAAGINLNRDFGDRVEVRGNYFFTDTDTRLNEQRFRQYWLPTDNYLQRDTQQNRQQLRGHRFNTEARFRLDTMQDLSFNLSGRWLQNSTFDNWTNQRLSVEEVLRNSSSQNRLGVNDRSSWQFGGIYRRKLGKPGRNFVLDASWQQGNIADEDELRARSSFGLPANTLRIDTLQQLQNNEGEEKQYAWQFRYTEPLGKRQYLELRQSREHSSGSTNRRFYDIPTFAEVPLFNEQLSNAYTNDYRYDQFGLSYRRVRDDLNLNIGLDAQYALLAGDEQQQDISVRHKFRHLLPRLSADWTLGSMRSLRLDYNTELRPPTLQQLSPIVNNSDPLSIYRGNPDLSATYIHRLSLNFNSFSPFSMVSLFAGARAEYLRDPVVNSRSVDSLFRQVLQPVNVQDTWQGEAFLSLGFPIRPLKIRTSISVDSRWTQGLFLLNGQENSYKRGLNMLEWSVENRKKDKLDVRGGLRLIYDFTRYKQSSAINQDIWDRTLFVSIALPLGERWQVTADYNDTYYRNTQQGFIQRLPLFGASLTRYFLNKRLELTLTCFDLLARNTGIQRQANWNYLEVSDTQSLNRYFMLQASYRLSANRSAEMPGMQIQRPSRR